MTPDKGLTCHHPCAHHSRWRKSLHPMPAGSRYDPRAPTKASGSWLQPKDRECISWQSSTAPSAARRQRSSPSDVPTCKETFVPCVSQGAQKLAWVCNHAGICQETTPGTSP